MHYKQISKGHFEWINVGEFHDGEMELRMEGMSRAKGGFLSEKSGGFLLLPNLHNKYSILLS